MQKSVKEDRQLWIGGSDIPVIMGISPFQTRYDMLLFKAGIKENNFDGNEYTEYGNIMEPKIRECINCIFNLDFVEGKHEDKKQRFRCHTDGETDDMILEIKTTSQIHSSLDEYKIYLVQLLFYMMCTNRKKGMLVVYHRPEDFSEEFDEDRMQIYQFDIDRYKELCDEIMNSIKLFKEDLEKIKENPLISEEDLVPEPIRELANSIVEMEKQLALYKEAEKHQKQLKEELYNKMEEYGVKKWITPNGTLITKVASTPDKTETVFNEEKLKEADPDTYEKYLEEKTKKGKSGYVKITLGKENE